jgi:ankyrin repeat protein
MYCTGFLVFLGIALALRRNQRGRSTTLHWTARTGNTNVAEFLIANGANVNAGDDSTPLQEAAYYSMEMVELLIAKGADINAGPWTALHGAVDAGQRSIAELIIAKGADVNARDGKGRTPLHLAAWYQPDLVKLLVTNAANVNAKDNQQRTPLSYVIDGDNTEVAELLRKHGATE